MKLDLSQFGTREALIGFCSSAMKELPSKCFAVRFQFNYDLVTSPVEQSQETLVEKGIMQLLMRAHFKQHQNQFKTCMSDLIFVE
jgi:hypothetical protein